MNAADRQAYALRALASRIDSTAVAIHATDVVSVDLRHAPKIEVLSLLRGLSKPQVFPHAEANAARVVGQLLTMNLDVVVSVYDAHHLVGAR